MRTSERLRAIKEWAYFHLCMDRKMKCPDETMDITKVTMQEPKVYLAWLPSRPDATGMLAIDPPSVCPSILIMPVQSHGKYVEEKRFDRYNKVHRPQEMGQELAVQFLFSVYEPGVRLPGFLDSVQDDVTGEGADMSKLMEGTEQGLLTLTNWMDDCVSRLISDMFIPNSDLFVQDASVTYSLYSDQSYVVDKRPIFYGFVNVTFSGYADDRNEEAVNALMM